MTVEQSGSADDPRGYDFAAWLSAWVRREFGDRRPGSTANQWVELETLEYPPGWAITVSLTGTSLQDAGLKAVHAFDVESERSEHDWIHCWVDGGLKAKDLEWQGRGGAENLVEILNLFRSWVEAESATD